MNDTQTHQNFYGQIPDIIIKQEPNILDQNQGIKTVSKPHKNNQNSFNPTPYPKTENKEMAKVNKFSYRNHSIDQQAPITGIANI